jgi:hypothetical protein
MNEPLRWLEDHQTSASLREVLRAAPEVPSMPTELHENFSSLLAQGVLEQTKVGTLWAKLLFGASSSVKTALIVTLMGVAGTGSYYLAGQLLHPGAAARPSESRVPVGLKMPKDGVPVTRVVVTSAPVVESIDEVQRPALPRPTRAADPVSGKETVADSMTSPRSMQDQQVLSNGAPRAIAAFDDPSIADEAKLLEMARATLADNPRRALEIANRHQRLHSDGQLAAERELIAIDALLRLGRRQEAKLRAAPELAQAPDSLYARRLRQLLGPSTP